MRYIEVIVDTPAKEIDRRCEEMTAMGVGGFVIENEEDFRNFLENNHAYWDYVDEELEQKYQGLSRIKCYLTDDEAGRDSLRQIRAAYGKVAEIDEKSLLCYKDAAFFRDVDALADDIIAQAEIPERKLAANG